MQPADQLKCRICGKEFDNINRRQVLVELGIQLTCVECWKETLK